jgi:hypothetical protein
MCGPFQAVGRAMSIPSAFAVEPDRCSVRAQAEHSGSAIPRRGHRDLYVALRMERTSPAFRQCRGRRSNA